jgi:hypothetical protein
MAKETNQGTLALPEPSLRPIDEKRLDGLQTLVESSPDGKDIWYIHSILAQCFLPYRAKNDQTHWVRENGNVALSITADVARNSEGKYSVLGLPYGAKPRLFMSKIQTDAIRNQSPVIPVEVSMTRMLKDLGFDPNGGKRGTIGSFKEQTSRLAACRFRIIHNQNTEKGTLAHHINADIFQTFDLWFPAHPDQQTLWPTEIVLTQEFYDNLKDHAIPYDFRGLKQIQSNSRAIDIYLWMTQRLHRISHKKPLPLNWDHLFEMFGGGISNPKH